MAVRSSLQIESKSYGNDARSSRQSASGPAVVGSSSKIVGSAVSYVPRPHGAPSRIRTCDTRFRKPLLYPLSYGGWLGLLPFVLDEHAISLPYTLSGND